MFTGVNILVLSEGSCWLTGPNEGTKHSDEIEALLDTKIEALEAGLLLQQLTGVDFKPVEIAP